MTRGQENLQRERCRERVPQDPHSRHDRSGPEPEKAAEKPEEKPKLPVVWCPWVNCGVGLRNLPKSLRFPYPRAV
jgi:hypothetical protein